MNILAIGDTHEPFAHKHYLEFCKETQLKYQCDDVVHVGDLVDNHALSFHDHDPNGYSPANEHKKALKKLKQWYKAFPELSLCKGNHDILVARQALSKGLPDVCVKAFRQIWELPSKWLYDWKHYFYDCCFEHGTGYGGLYPHMNIARNNRRKTVIGHCHGVAGSGYIANDKDNIWGLSTGCGIDRMEYAFWYGKDFKFKPVLGCGVILDSGHIAFHVPMIGVSK